MFPALTVQTPSASCSGEHWRTAFAAPRSLNDPTGWQVLQLEVHLARRVGVEPYERRPEGRAADAPVCGADVFQRDLSVRFRHRVVLYAIVVCR